MIGKYSAALCGGASLLVLASVAHAQEAPPPPAAAPAAQQLDTVVVTGSRIVRNGYNAPTPITVAPVEQLERTTPSNIPDALNKLPQFAGSSTSAGSSNTGGTPNVFGGNYLNLRSFGAIRTLVLLDGRRVPPTAINGQVDTDTLPQMLVQRVDVVTGGASAVYGSDAVTGVVNFVLDTKFTGLKAEAMAGASGHGDARSNRLGFAGGADVLDRGHVIFSLERYENEGVKRHEDRSWAASIPVYVGAGTAASPFMMSYNARLSGAAFGGLATSGPFNGQQFVGAGDLAAFNKGVATKSNGVAVGGDGAYYNDLNLTAPLTTTQGFTRFQYELTPQVTGFAQVSATSSLTANFHSSNAPQVPTTIYSGNAFLTASEQAQLTATNTPSFTMSRLNRDLAEAATLNQLTDAISATAGLKGNTFKDFKWEAYYTHGESLLRSRLNNNINYPNLYAALDAVKDSSGNAVCRVTLTNPGLYPGCVPIDMFGQNNQSAAAKKFIYGATEWQGLNRLDDAAASLAGSPFMNWAGPVSTAFNVEYRWQSLVQTSNASPLVAPSFTGIRMGQAPTSIWAYATQAPQRGSNSVWEASTELVFPLLSNVTLAKNLEFSGAVRYAGYSGSGGATTWKLGLNYQPIQDVRIRYTESRDIRAPTLNDLYSGTTISVLNVNDPHTGVNGVVNVVGGGNPNLVPEVARTTTVGLIYSPSWLPRFKASVDYYNIDIANAIGTINGSSTAVLQECETSGGTSPLCASIVRPLPFSNHTAANFPTFVYNQNLNIATTYTHGVDVEASYNFPLQDVVKGTPGSLDLRLLYSYQPVLASKAYPTAQLTNAAGVAGLSDNRASLTLDYKLGGADLTWQTRYYSSQHRSGNPLQIYGDPDLPAIFYHDVTLSYGFRAAGHSVQAFLSVTNLFDQAPRVSPSTTFTGIPGFGTPSVNGDDIVGRYYTTGLRFRF